jgi:hypothetical protein
MFLNKYVLLHETNGQFHWLAPATAGLFKSPKQEKREPFLVRMGQIPTPESEE